MTDGVLEMRLVVTAEDYNAAVAFYRDTLGLSQLAAFDASLAYEFLGFAIGDADEGLAAHVEKREPRFNQ